MKFRDLKKGMLLVEEYIDEKVIVILVEKKIYNQEQDDFFTAWRTVSANSDGTLDLGFFQDTDLLYSEVLE